jgi:8-oxo-dGTP pyrophosphatase MutT (NUDIX family)
LQIRLLSFGKSTSDKAVIFVHGVNGDPAATWRNAETDFFWPEALAAQSPWAVYSLGYPAATNLGPTMPVQQRAKSVLRYLVESETFKGKDVAFVCHSFGGIVVTQMLRHMNENRDTFLNQVAGVVFVSTPHQGSAVASLGDSLRNVIASTVTLEDLRFGSPMLADLNEWFRQTDFPEVLSFGEARRLKRFGMRIWPVIVPRISADPGLKRSQTIPVDADHFEICRPAGNESPQSVSTLAFLKRVFALPANYHRYPKQVAAVAYRRRGQRLQFLLVKTTGGRWTFPKGHIEADLGEAASASNEAYEEAGASGRVSAEPLCHYLHSKLEWKRDRGDAQIFCIAAYLFEVERDDACEPEEGREPTWMNPEAAKIALAEDRDFPFTEELGKVVDTAVRAIKSN